MKIAPHGNEVDLENVSRDDTPPQEVVNEIQVEPQEMEMENSTVVQE